MIINRQTSLLREMFTKGGLMTFSFTRLDSRNALLLGIVATALFFSASCKNNGMSDGAANANTSSTSTPNTNSTNSSPTRDEGKYKELLDKTDELAKLAPPLKLDPKARIKGKVLLVGNFNYKHGHVDEGISSLRKAESLEELETLIQVVCSKGKFLANYEKGVKGYASDCKLSLVDYRAPAVIAQKNFSNTEREEVIRESDVRDNEYVAPQPVGDIRSYIDSLQVDKVMPMGKLLDEKELLRVATVVNLNPNATMKGKIKVVDKYEEGEIHGWLPYTKLSNIETYGLPSQKFTYNPEELETLIRVVCTKGSPIGKAGNWTEYSNKCEVSLIDYKSLSVFAQKTFENKELEPNVTEGSLPVNWVVKRPKQEIEGYLKSFPT